MSARCPYLGLAESRDQVGFVAHPRHRCYVALEPQRVGCIYQASTCLSFGYLRCPRLTARVPTPRSAPGPRPATPLPAARVPAPRGAPSPRPAVPLPAAHPAGERSTELRQARRAPHGRVKAFELLIVGLLLSAVVAALVLGYAVYHRLEVGPGMDVALAGLEAAPPRLTLVATYTPTAPATATPAPTAPPATPVPALPTPVSTSPPTPATAVPRPPAVSPPTRLVIATISLDIPVKPVGPKEVRQGSNTRVVWGDVPNAGGFHNTSAYPGNGGNIVINGHRDIAGAVFLHLDRVGVGDEIVVYVGEVAYRYQVSEVLIVPETYATAAQRASNRALIGAYPGERLTLVTCTPVGLATHRLVVIAHPPPVVTPDMPAAGDEP